MPTNMPAATPSASPVSGKALIGLAGLAVGLLVGYGAGRVSTGTPVNPLSDKKGGYEEGYEAAMLKVSQSGLIAQGPSESQSIGGTVKAVSANRLTIEADLASFDPLGLRKLPKEREVAITDTTVLMRLERLSPAEYDAAQQAYAAALADFVPDADGSSIQPLPPNPFVEKAITLADIAPGDQVSVSAASDILMSVSFEATGITLLPASLAPALDDQPSPADPSAGPPGAVPAPAPAP